jgi:acetyltransferase-like isoleucine patch superfamily enzyme
MTEKLDNVPRAVFDSGVSKRRRYQQLVIGRDGWGPLLRYEVIMLLANRVPGALGLFLRSRLYPGLLGACGRNVFFGMDVVFRHPHKIAIGDNVVIDDGAVLDAKGFSNRGITIQNGVFVGRHTILHTKDGDITLEDGVNLSASCAVFSASSVRIGRNTLVAGNCSVVGGGHDFSRHDVPISEQGRPSRGIEIGADSWMGIGVCVLDGIRIGHDAVIGANSVVTHDVPAFAVAAGNPARVLRDRREERRGDPA